MNDRVRTRSFRAAVVVVALIGLIWCGRAWMEPRFHGRGIHSWIEQLPYDTSAKSEPQEALRYFGNDAVPYLMDAMTRSAKWESGLLAKIPQEYVSYLFDLGHYRQVRLHAIGKLQELVISEALENELQMNPKSPVRDQVLPVWRRELERDPSRLFSGLYGLAPSVTNIAPLLRDRFEKQNPYTSPDWLDVASVLAETHDRTLVPIFMRFATPTNALMMREWAFRVLERNGYSNEQVEATLREALTSTNSSFRGAAISTCAYLNVCTREVLASINAQKAVLADIGPTEIQNIEIYEPIIRWRANTNDVEAAKNIERNLRPGAKYPHRLNTAGMLGRIGPEAKRFVPTLVRIAREEGPPFQTDALRALKSIAPEEARAVLTSLPPRRTRHAATAKPAG